MSLPPLVEPAESLTVDEVRRYSRHLIIPDFGAEAQLRLKNADNAQTLALALSQQKGDRELIQLLVSAQFDTGAYEFVRWRDAGGNTVFERAEAPRASQAPGWFRSLLPIDAAPGRCCARRSAQARAARNWWCSSSR